jgi:hypothetical protein
MRVHPPTCGLSKCVSKHACLSSTSVAWQVWLCTTRASLSVRVWPPPPPFRCIVYRSSMTYTFWRQNSYNGFFLFMTALLLLVIILRKRCTSFDQYYKTCSQLRVLRSDKYDQKYADCRLCSRYEYDSKISTEYAQRLGSFRFYAAKNICHKNINKCYRLSLYIALRINTGMNVPIRLCRWLLKGVYQTSMLPIRLRDQ